MAHAYISVRDTTTWDVRVTPAHAPGLGAPALFSARVTVADDGEFPPPVIDRAEAALGASGWVALDGRWTRPDAGEPVLWSRVTHQDGERAPARPGWELVTLGQLRRGDLLGLVLDTGGEGFRAEASGDWHPAEDTPGLLTAVVGADPATVRGSVVEIGWHPAEEEAPTRAGALRTITGLGITRVWRRIG